MNSNDDNKVFNRKEVAKILDKATQLQLGKDSSEDGLTQKEILQLAKDVGINEHAILSAIQSHNHPSFDSKFDWLKGTTRVQTVELIDAELTEEVWEEVVLEIRRITGGIGKVSKVGNSYEWEQRRRDIGYKHFSLNNQNGKTRLQYVSSWGGLKMISSMFTFMTFLAIAAIGMEGLGVSEIFSISIAAASGFAGIYTIGRAILKRHFEGQKRHLQTLVEGVSSVLRRRNIPEITMDEHLYSTEAQYEDPNGTKLKS